MPRLRACLDRKHARSLISGRCPKNLLPGVCRHVAGCSRCRAVVVAAASGAAGPGDTVADAPPHRALWYALRAFPVALAVALSGVAWLVTEPRGVPIVPPVPPSNINTVVVPAAAPVEVVVPARAGRRTPRAVPTE